MALFHCDFFSHILDLSTSMDVILPQARESQARRTSRRTYPTLFLLHGLSDDHTIWQRRTSIERYVDGWNLAVVMPNVHRSYYADMANGYRYWTFISQELPTLVRMFFPLSQARRDNFVAGLSMGGYGAFKLAMSYPDRFSYAASLSGALDIVDSLNDPDPQWQMEVKTIFGRGRRLPGSSNDLFHLAKKIAASAGQKPRFYQWCGWDDSLYPENIAFRDHAQGLGLDLTYEEGPGDHEWGAWDLQIQRVLEWLPLRRLI